MGKSLDIHVKKRMALKAFKIAVGSGIAIVIAEFFGLKYTTTAGVITLLTVQNTRKDTIQLTLERFWSFLLSILLIYICFHYTGSRDWVNFIFYILFMVMSCYYFDWANTISVNAVMGTHYLTAPDYSLGFALNELSLILIGTSVAIALNWKMPCNMKVLRQHIRKIEDDMQQVLLELSQYLQGDRKDNHVWTDLDELELYLEKGLDRAHEQAKNSLSEADLYYVDYMEMRLQQCSMLQTLRGTVLRVREIPKQAEIISQYLDYLVYYIHEENIPDEQIQNLQKVFDQMRREELPKSRAEFENRAVLYHLLMDLEEFLLVKKRFLDKHMERPEELEETAR